MARVPEDINADITPTEFELLVKEYLENLGKELSTFHATHDVKFQASDGEYQLDILAEFDYLGASFKVLVECKRHKNKLKREVVQLMNDRLRSIGAQKGMIFCTSGFQSGALEYAEQHGIALIRVIEGKFTYFTKAADSQSYDPPPWADIPKYVGEYRQENTFSYLQPKYFEPLEEFLFGVK